MADIKSFMKLIKAMESSGGKDTRHVAMDSGLHEGDAAIGNYGLMPNTAKEIAARRQAEGVGTPSDDVIRHLENSQVNQLLNENPVLAKQYTEFLAKKIMDKTKGDPVAGMTSWFYGHNLSPKQIQQKMEDNPAYVDKVNQRIDENHLQSKMPSLMDLMKVYPPDFPRSKK